MSDIVDHANALADQQRADAIAAHHQRTVAVERASAGAMPGVCIGCGDAIDLRRIAALPNAARCLHCQQRFENQNRRR